MIRLYSIAGFGDESDFYNDRGVLREEGILREIFERPQADRNWGQMPEALNRLAEYYGPGESRQFVRDVATLFAGLRTRSEAPDIDDSIAKVVHPWVYLAEDESLGVAWTGTRDDDANVHHWAALLLAGHELGQNGAILINFYRELFEPFPKVWSMDRSDWLMGTAAARMGHILSEKGMSDVGALLRATIRIR